MRVGIFSGTAAEQDIESLLNKVREVPEMSGASFSETVSTKQTYVVPAVGTKKFQVAALDLGIKSMTPQLMAQRGIEVHVVPANISAEDFLAAGPDGIFVSNGPGDPATALHAISLVQAALDAKRPFFGICFGNQILGRALGFGTYKLRYGHRGINQPVMDRKTNKVEVTAHNHGFAVDAPIDRDSQTPYGTVRVSHVCLNDNVVEGLECVDVPAFSVQYHPEAGPGPHDSRYLFAQFAELMEGK
jgi:carbamoyl-phosphate synthase small subunit